MLLSAPKMNKFFILFKFMCFKNSIMFYFSQFCELCICTWLVISINSSIIDLSSMTGLQIWNFWLIMAFLINHHGSVKLARIYHCSFFQKHENNRRKVKIIWFDWMNKNQKNFCKRFYKETMKNVLMIDSSKWSIMKLCAIGITICCQRWTRFLKLTKIALRFSLFFFNLHIFKMDSLPLDLESGCWLHKIYDPESDLFSGKKFRI